MKDGFFFLLIYYINRLSRFTIESSFCTKQIIFFKKNNILSDILIRNRNKVILKTLNLIQQLFFLKIYIMYVYSFAFLKSNHHHHRKIKNCCMYSKKRKISNFKQNIFCKKFNFNFLNNNLFKKKKQTNNDTRNGCMNFFVFVFLLRDLVPNLKKQTNIYFLKRFN